MLKFVYNIRSWCYWVMIQELWKTPNNSKKFKDVTLAKKFLEGWRDENKK